MLVKCLVQIRDIADCTDSGENCLPSILRSGAGQMAQLLRAMAALLEDRVHSPVPPLLFIIICNSSHKESDTFSDLHRHQARTWCTYIYADKALAHNILNIK